MNGADWDPSLSRLSLPLSVYDMTGYGDKLSPLAPLRMQPRYHGVVREWSSQELSTQNYDIYMLPAFLRKKKEMDINQQNLFLQLCNAQ